MKKIGLSLLLFGAFSTIASGSSINGEYEGHSIVNVVVKGQKVNSEVPAINYNGVTLIPLRAASEALGATVYWEPTTYSAYLNPQSTAPQISDVDNFKSYVSKIKKFYSDNDVPVSNFSVNVDEKGIYFNAVLKIDNITQNNLNYNIAMVSSGAIDLKNYNSAGISIQLTNQGILVGEVTILTSDILDIANKKISFEQFVSKWSIKIVNNQLLPQSVSPPTSTPNNTAICNSINNRYDQLIRDLLEELNSRGILDSTINTQRAQPINDSRNAQLQSYGCPTK